PEPFVHVAIDLVEASRGVPGAEVRAPSTQDRVEVTDHHAQIRVAPSPRRHVSHPLPDPLHRALRRLTMQEVHALALALPDHAAQALAEIAAEEVEALRSIIELDAPRLLGMDLEPQARQDDLDAPLGFFAPLPRLAHHDEIV